MKNAIRQEKIRGSIKRLENMVATKPFQDALQNLIDDSDELAKAEKDPDPYFTSFGVVIPKGFEIEIKREKPADQKEAAALQASFLVMICVSWCTEEACYTYCIRF